ncbi:MAG: hypothetical protein WBL20_02260 [Sphingobium sp.]|uniref:hypothetical protein n=1 Tax=Sphingobium sp. TaxID=1912891 RepID=UPI002E1B22CC
MLRLVLPLLLTAATLPEAMPDDPVLRTLLEGEAAQAAGDGAALLDTAQVLKALGATPAEGQQDLAALWTQEAEARGVTKSALGFRGRALGPAYHRGALNAGDKVILRQLFLAGQRAQISVAPAGRAKLSVRVQDAGGSTLCQKDVGGPQADCAWMPLFTDRYAIVIENGGASPAAFYLIMK